MNKQTCLITQIEIVNGKLKFLWITNLFKFAAEFTKFITNIFYFTYFYSSNKYIIIALTKIIVISKYIYIAADALRNRWYLFLIKQ